MKTATEGFGAQLEYADLGTTTFTKVAQTKDVGMPSTTLGAVAVVHNDLANRTKEMNPGLLTPEEFEVDIVYTKAQAAALHTLKNAAQVKTWRVTVPDGPDPVDPIAGGSTMVFDGFITKLPYESETDDGIFEGTLTIQQTGIETFTPADDSV